MRHDKYTNYYEFYKKDLKHKEDRKSFLGQVSKQVFIIALVGGTYYAYDKHGETIKLAIKENTIFQDITSYAKMKIKDFNKETEVVVVEEKPENTIVKAVIVNEKVNEKKVVNNLIEESIIVKTKVEDTVVEDMTVIEDIAHNDVIEEKVIEENIIVADNPPQVKISVVTVDDNTNVKETIVEVDAENESNRVTLIDLAKKRKIEKVLKDLRKEKNKKNKKKSNSDILPVSDVVAKAREVIRVASLPPESTSAQNMQTTTATVASDTAEYITVREGDTLGTIAKRAYGSSKLYKRIYKANKDILSSPNGLNPGQKLRIR